MHEITVADLKIGRGNPLVLIAGPCVIEDESIVMRLAGKIKKIAAEQKIPVIFKASYEKDNRSTYQGYRGPGLEKGLKILARVKNELDLPVTSDVHRESDIPAAARVLDIIQIPAFLSQQTSLLLKAGETGKCINIKKGQFIAPENMQGSVGKIESTGNKSLLLTERGSCFGYNRLVSDICSIPLMQDLGYPVFFDATHIIRVYGISSHDKQGGLPRFIFPLALAGVAAGCDGIFIETHDKPEAALCDAASMLPLQQLSSLLQQAVRVNRIIKESASG